jgi:hypothetical protein
MSATYDSEYSGGGWEKTSRRAAGRGRKALEDDYDPWADYGDDQDDYCAPVPQWPRQQVARPSVAFLVKHYAPIPTRPKPLDPEYLQRYTEFKEKLKAATEAVVAAEVAEKKAVAAAGAEEAAQKSLNAWSRTQTKIALLQRLKREVAEATETKRTKVEARDKLLKSGETISALIGAHKKSVEGFEKYRTTLHELWDCEHGYEHRALRSEADLFAYYDPVERGKPTPGGWVRYVMAEGTDMEKLCREFDRGGHEQIRSDGLVLWLRAEILGDVGPVPPASPAHSARSFPEED